MPLACSWPIVRRHPLRRLQLRGQEYATFLLTGKGDGLIHALRPGDAAQHVGVQRRWRITRWPWW
jgi:hypothetical protein